MHVVQGPVGVTSVVLCTRRRPVDFRYTSLATEAVRRCDMSRRDNCDDNFIQSPLDQKSPAAACRAAFSSSECRHLKFHERTREETKGLI
jgi:hypothetical protein